MNLSKAKHGTYDDCEALWDYIPSRMVTSWYRIFVFNTSSYKDPAIAAPGMGLATKWVAYCLLPVRIIHMTKHTILRDIELMDTRRKMSFGRQWREKNVRCASL